MATNHDIYIVNYLTKQFLCCAVSVEMDFMALDSSDLNFDIQKQILDNTVNSDLVKRYPIKTSYQKVFLKLLMQKIEEGDNEIHDDLYEAYCRLILLPDESVHYRHFLIENGILNCITLKESTNLISEGTTGLCSWQGAVALSQWCVENKGQFCGKNVLELGSGVGLTGINVIGVCSPKRYIFSDCHPTVLSMLCENVKLNFLSNEQCKLLNTSKTTKLKLKLQLKYEQIDVQVINLKWEDIDKYSSKDLSQPDIIIAADILYESNSFDSLTSGLKSLLTSNNYAIFAATIRNEDTVSLFLDHLGNYDLIFEECSLPKWTISIQLIDAPVRIFKIFQKI